MFKRELLKRFLPMALSVAMVFQSLPATAMAAEPAAENVVQEAADGSPSDNGTVTPAPTETESVSEMDLLLWVHGFFGKCNI